MNQETKARGPLPLKLAVIVGVPALLLVDTAIAFGAGWRGRLAITVAVVSLAILACVFLLLCFPRGRAILHEHSGRVAYVMLSAVIAWLAAEAIAAVYLALYPTAVDPVFHRRQQHQEWTYVPAPEYLPGIYGDSRYTTNSIGIRGPEFPPRDAAYRILSIGGSTTECTYLDDSEVWQHLLAERLNQEEQLQDVWIGGIGISGFPTVNHRKFVEKSPLMDEIDCLLLLVGANDFNTFIRGDLVGSKFLGRRHEAPLWDQSPILTVLRERWQRRKESPHAEDQRGLNIHRRRQIRQNSYNTAPLPDLDDALHEYEKRLVAIVESTRSKGVRPVFITQPTLWADDLPASAQALLDFGDMPGKRYLSIEAGREGIDRYNETLVAVCKRMDVECIDAGSMHGQEPYYYDDFHYNEAGAHAMAALVADWFVERANPPSW
ncbi:MAG: SGNH/GDSL hydrolase family protein [Planctomycetota bacterium]|jgi:lysophospholipase L1-like esterase